MIPNTVSLFCGAGGESLGKHLAFEELGIPTRDLCGHAINHWDLAVATHGRNFPWIQVHQEDITEVTAATYGLERIHLLWASPSCVHHSRARGGLPKEEQQRSHAWEVVDRWLRVAQVDVLMIENVPEFEDWGPLHTTHTAECKEVNRPAIRKRFDAAKRGKKPAPYLCAKGCHFNQPIKERKGEFFVAFVADLKGLGYTVEHRCLVAADYGDPTIRRRFFLQAVRDGLPIVWPEPTHRNPKKPAGLFDAALPPWRTAAECIDWSIPVPSIFDRKKPLAEATLRRIAAGVERFVLKGRPFIVNLSHGQRLEDADQPMKTITTAKGGEKAIVSATMVGVGGRAGQTAPRPLDAPMGTGTTKADTALVAASMVRTDMHKSNAGCTYPMDEAMRTVTTAGGHGLMAASMVSLRGTSPDQIQASAGSVEAPLPTVSAGGGHAALVAAFMAKHYSGVVGAPLDQPTPTITGTDHNAIVAASLIQTGFGEREGQAPRVLDIQAPLGTVVAGGVKHGLVAATLVTNTSGHAPTDLTQPMPTLATGGHQALVAAFLQQYYGTTQGSSADAPLPTVTTVDRHSLVTVEIDGETYVITDIGMRMLEPRELARAMGFPEWFKFETAEGKPLTKRDAVKMIGNACPVGTVKALIKAVIQQRPGIFQKAGAA